MKKLFKKILFVLLIIFFLLILFGKKSFAIDGIKDKVQDPSGIAPEQQIVTIVNPILTLIQIVTVGVAVGLIIMDGIKLLTTADNSEKANLKRKLLYYVIGAFFIFIPTTVIKYISDVTSTLIT